tara:strand:- start:200 stop:496 length:297 start_codon:yes stop_codon:yes gene_type:complete
MAGFGPGFVILAIYRFVGYISRLMKAKELRQFLDKFLVSPVAQNARIQIEMPNGEKLDVSEIQLLESRVIGDRDTHILNFKGVKLTGTWKMPKIVGKL